jgi:hypothetical protein
MQQSDVIVESVDHVLLSVPLTQVGPEDGVELIVPSLKLHRRVLQVSHDGSPALKSKAF